MDTLLNRTLPRTQTSQQLSNGTQLKASDIIVEAITEFNEFSKSDYDRILKEKRRAFIHTHFKKDLKRIFKDLREMSENKMECKYIAIFEHVPHYFDQEKTKKFLVLYFSDLGYTVEPICNSVADTISFTLQ